MVRSLILIALLIATGCSKGPLKFAEELASNEGTGTPAGGVIQNTAESRLRLAPRDYVASSLKEIFGSGSAAMVDDLVSTRIGQFGGPCDPAIAGDCTQNGDSLAPLVPAANSARAALSVRVCDKIAATDSAVSYAGSLAAGSATPVTTRAPSSTEIAAMYDSFFPGRVPTQEIVDDLKGISDQARILNYPYIESWRFVLLTLCMSPDWQIP